MRSLACAAAFIALIALASIATAQAPAPAAMPVAATGSPAPPSADSDPEPSASTPPKPFPGATGYSYGVAAAPAVAPRTARPRGRTARANEADSDAIMPGFETLGDGSTRLFVELTKSVSYDAKAGRTTITFVLKRTRIDRRNNQNPLVTVHFNTPVASARLVPHGRDVWFVVGLRANTSPTWSMDAKADGTATLHIAFPKGDYLPKEAVDTASQTVPEKTAPPATP
jgi:hypothetical protein